jgi:hypothetical protein
VDKRGFDKHLFRQPERLLLVFAVLISFNQKLISQQTETMVKAVAFEKLSMFISWPINSTGNDSMNEFVITVLGENPFGNTLDQLYGDKKIKGKKVVVNYINSIQNLIRSDILFISKMKMSEAKKVISSLKGLPVLTISDTEGFAEAGCFINLYEFEDRLRFEINQKGMQDAGFTVDYRLLRVSKVLNPVLE